MNRPMPDVFRHNDRALFDTWRGYGRSCPSRYRFFYFMKRIVVTSMAAIGHRVRDCAHPERLTLNTDSEGI